MQFQKALPFPVGVACSRDAAFVGGGWIFVLSFQPAIANFLAVSPVAPSTGTRKVKHRTHDTVWIINMNWPYENRNFV